MRGEGEKGRGTQNVKTRKKEGKGAARVELEERQLW